MSLNVTYYSKLYSTESTTVVIDKDKATIAEVLSDMHVSKEHKRVFVNDMQVTDMSLEVSSNDIITVLEYVEDSAGDFFDGLLVVGGMILMGAAMMTGFGIPGALMLIGGAGLTTLGAADYAKRHFEAPDISVKDSVKDRPDLYGGKNSIHADAPIPVVLGTSLVSPYVVGDYWSEATDGDDGNDMYIHGLLCFGYGPLHLTNFKLGDSALGVSMTDPKVSGKFSQILRPSSVTSAYLTPDDVIELEIRQGYPRAYDKNIYDKRVREELPNIEIVWANTVSQAEYMKMTPARMTARSLTKDSGTYKYKVGVVVGAQGFAMYNKNGDSSAVPITIRLMWRAPGTETWQNFSDTSSYKVVDQKSTEKEVRYNLVGNYSGTLPQIEITVVRSRPNCVNGHSPDHRDTDTKDTYMDKWIWASMRTHTEDPVFPDERVARQLCLVAIRAKATTNVNGSLDALNCIASSMLPSLNVTTGLWPLAKPDALNPNSVWATWTKTSNPADMYLAMFMGIYAPTSRVNLAQCQATGTRFAWDKLRDLWVWCNENRTITLTNGSTKTVKNCQYNRYITNAVKLKDMLDAILRFARAQYITEGPRYSLIHDAVYNKYASYTTRYRNPYNQIVSKALITPRNGKDFAVSKDYKETPDALKISIASAAAGYVKQQIVVRNPTITQAELDAKIQAGTAVFEEDTYEGITDAYIATMYAWYRFGVYIHRRVTCTLSTDIEHLFYSVGDRVSAATDVILTGYSYGRISTYIEDETGYDVVLDDSVEFPAGEALGIVIWSMSTGNVLPVPCTPVNATDRGDGVLITRFVRVNTKSTEIAESLGSDIYYVVGKLGSETKPWLVLAKERVDDDRAKLTLVEANPEVHNSDDGSIEEYEFDTSVIKGRSITDSSPASSQIQTPDPFASIGAVSGTVYVIENGDPAVTIPDNVHSVSVRASEAGLNISWGWTPSGAKPLANNVKRFIVDISRNAGVDWPVTLYPLKNEVTYAFDKDTDGLPTADDLVNYRVRVKAENAYSIVSPEYTPDDEGSLIDTTGFKGWEPLVPSLGFRVSGRMITVNVSTGSDWYGKGPFELQIAKGYSVLPNGEIVTIVSPDSLVWFAPSLGVDPYASYENYKEGAEGAYIQRTGTSVTLVLPLYGQNEDPVSARDTPYYFRVRGTTIANGEKLESVWSDPELTVAMATTATDVVRAWKLDDNGDRVKVDGALGAHQIYAEFLSAITSNLGLITDGALRGNENNMWALSRVETPDGIVYEGTVRMGGSSQYLRITPVVQNGIVVDYNIDFKVGNFTVTAIGSVINGVFEVRNLLDSIDYFKVDPANNGKVTIRNMLSVGNVLAQNDRLAVQESAGVYDLVFEGTGANSLNIALDSNIPGDFEVSIVEGGKTVDDWEVSASNALYYRVALLNGIYYSGSSTSIAKYINGVWSVCLTAASGYAFGEIFSVGGKLFIYETTGSVYVTSDGMTFTKASTTGMNDWLRSVVFGNGIFVLTDGSGHVLTSSDGHLWTLRATLNSFSSPAWVCFGNGVFIAKSMEYTNPQSEAIFRSSDGITWTKVLSAPNIISIFEYGSNAFICSLIDNNWFISTDGETWVKQASRTYPFQKIQGTDLMLLALDSAGSLWSSCDAGTTWTERSKGAIPTLSGTQFRSSESRFIVINSSGVIYSTNDRDRQTFKWREGVNAWSDTLKIFVGASYSLEPYGINLSFSSGESVTGDRWTFSQGAIGAVSVVDTDNEEFFSIRGGKVKIGAIPDLESEVAGKQDAVSLTASRAVITDSSGHLAVSPVTASELAFLDGVTGNIQTQLGNKAPLASPAFTGRPTAYGAPLAAVETSSSSSNTDFPIGTVITAFVASYIALGASATIRLLDANSFSANTGSANTGSGTVVSGTWRARGICGTLGSTAVYQLFQRVA